LADRRDRGDPTRSSFIREIKVGNWISEADIVNMLIFWVAPVIIPILGGAVYRRWRRR